jgi:hypothetical protein
VLLLVQAQVIAQVLLQVLLLAALLVLLHLVLLPPAQVLHQVPLLLPVQVLPLVALLVLLHLEALAALLLTLLPTVLVTRQVDLLAVPPVRLLPTRHLPAQVRRQAAHQVLRQVPLLAHLLPTPQVEAPVLLQVTRLPPALVNRHLAVFTQVAHHLIVLL